MNPLGKTLEHGFLPVPLAAPAPLLSVPFPYGAPVLMATGTTVAVLRTTTAEAELLAPPGTLTARLEAAAAPDGDAVTVTVERATVTVTWAQDPDAATVVWRPAEPEAPPADPEAPAATALLPAEAIPPTAEPLAEEAGITVTYLVEVWVP